MKKFILLLILSLLSLYGKSQIDETNKPKLSFGIHGGLNVSRFNTEMDSTEINGRPGAQIGLSLRYGGRFFIQSDINFIASTSQLIHLDTSLANVDVKSTLNRSMLSIPISLGYKILQSKDKKSSLYLTVGADFTSVLKTQLDANAFYITKDDFQPFSAGAKTSLGADIYFFHFDLGILWGLTPLLENDSKSLNRMISANIGINF